MNETVSSSIDSKYQRARCPSCGVVCEQRSRTVRELTGDILQARECIECEMIYRVSEQADRLIDAEQLPDGWSVDHTRRTCQQRTCTRRRSRAVRSLELLGVVRR